MVNNVDYSNSNGNELTAIHMRAWNQHALLQRGMLRSEGSDGAIAS